MNARRWVATLAGASLVATVSVVAAGSTVTVANADVAPTAAGLVKLATNFSTNAASLTYFKTTNTTSTPDATQTLSIVKPTKCQLGYTTPAAIASFASDPTGADSYPGLQNGGIGVASSNKRNGKECAQTSAATSNQPQEALTVTLDGSDTIGDFGPTVAYGALLDVELKGDVTVVANLLRNGQPTGKKYAVSSIAGATVSGVSTVTACNAGRADSGPDSLNGDNCFWPIGKASLNAGSLTQGSATLPTTKNDADLFDGVLFTVVSGAFALEGGSDWAAVDASARTVFFMASTPSAVVTCGDKGEQPATATQWGFKWWRLDNGSGACEPVGVGFATTATSFTLYKPAGTQDSAQWRIELTKSAASAVTPGPAVKIDWQDGTTPVKNIAYCDDSFFDGTSSGYNKNDVVFPSTEGTFPNVSYSTLISDPAKDQSKPTTANGFQHACLYSFDALLQGDSAKTTTVDNIYLTGDWKASY